jgi:hypothetical protein
VSFIFEGGFARLTPGPARCSGPRELRAESRMAANPGVDTGCRAWHQHGPMPPQCVRDATTAYLKAEDAIGQWLAECCAQRRRSADQMRLRIVEKLGERNNETSAQKGVYAKTGRPRLWAATRPWHRLVLPRLQRPGNETDLAERERQVAYENRRYGGKSWVSVT